MMKVTLIICASLFLLQASGQDRPSIDSLVFMGKDIVSDDPDSSLVYSYEAYILSQEQNYYWGKANAAGWIAEAYYFKGKMDSMDKYNQIALQLSRDEDDHVAIGDNLKSIGQSYSDRGEHSKALASFYEAIRYKELTKDTINLADINLRLGAVYDKRDILDTAMIKYDIALSYSRSINHIELIGQSLNNIAILQKKLGDYDKSLETLEEARSLFESIDNQYGLLINANMLGVTYKSMERYDEALAAYERLKDLSTELNIQRGLMAYGINTGTIYNILKQYKNAETSYRLAIELAEEMDIPLSLSDAKSGLGKSLLGQGKMIAAENEISAALRLAQQIKSIDKQLIAHKVAKEIYQQKNDVDKTVYHLESIQMLNDSVFQIEKAKQVDELQTQYETTKKDAEITLLNKNAEIDTIRKNALWGGIGLLALLSGGIIYGQRQRRKRIQVTAEKEKQIEISKRQNAEQELEHKKKELTAKVLHLASKNEFLQSIEEEVTQLKSSVDFTVSRASQKISRMINSDQLDNKEWEQFGIEFSSIHQDFMDRLKDQYGDFSNHEWRLISLFKMNLSTKDIANTLRISPNGVKKARYRLRKKMNLPSEVDIQDYLISF